MQQTLFILYPILNKTSYRFHSLTLEHTLYEFIPLVRDNTFYEFPKIHKANNTITNLIQEKHL